MTFYVKFWGIDLKLEADVSGDEIDGGLSVYVGDVDITDLIDIDGHVFGRLCDRFYEALNEHRGGR